jgi:predicted dehydrogenase
VAAFSSTFDHRAIVEACAPRKIHVMMEKPLAVSLRDARAMEQASSRAGIELMVNYETTWYRSHAAIGKLVKEQGALGASRRVVAMHGHPGPREIKVGPEFLDWLTDPVRNGAGALFDFGCYGANLMTWLMDNARPDAVTAVTRRFKPDLYPRVDDDATILIDYPRAQAVVQASWNWPFNRKDLEVYGERGQAIATGGGRLSVRTGSQAQDQEVPLPELPPQERDSIAYLAAIARGERKPAGLSSFANNMRVTEILDAARESARTGRRVVLR